MAVEVWRVRSGYGCALSTASSDARATDNVVTTSDGVFVNRSAIPKPDLRVQASVSMKEKNKT